MITTIIETQPKDSGGSGGRFATMSLVMEETQRDLTSKNDNSTDMKNI
jgi:hypothetical protein